ncbi:hypothetical protein K3725_15530 [Leisingera sp. S132]|uniref:hypothetical protein n=1 Tax=Leisingera sp. S132 TaxID=2867016 RepID=UPI0021A737E2|nr:hypothetical protein [Leisingera sp. S132]UWQ78705.1 hypothetical protein K3725_15530 [Leisingera sp. S132]
MRWISAQELENWARTLASETELPGIVSDLIRASIDDISDIRFPSGDKGRVRGFDGHLTCQTAKLFVPKGKSLWEFGTNQNYKSKASGDFEKRSKEVPLHERQKTTYVFVSPWTWDSSDKENKLEDFIKNQKEKYDWLDILYIDGSKLQTWFESCPAVAAWHARNTIRIKPRSGVKSIDEFWDDFVGRFDPKLVEGILLSGRTDNASSLVDQLMSGPGPIKISADSTDEVIAFAIAAIRSAKPEARLFLEARTLIIDSLEAGRNLLSHNNLIFLLNGETVGTPGQFYDRAATLIPLGRRQKSGTSSQLNRPTGYELGKALLELGIPEPKAMALARGCGRSLSALQRLIPSGGYSEPKWCTDTQIFPAILAGAWDGSNDADRELIYHLTGTADYDELTDRLRVLAKEDDPPFVIEGGVWKVSAPIDAFIHTAGRMNRRLFTLLEASFQKVFSAVRDDEQEEFLNSSSEKYKSPYSEWLREGLANTLLMISALGEQAEAEIDDDYGKSYVDRNIARLPGLNGNVELLACINNELPLLAEASPVPFLRALEHWLEGDVGSLREIFSEEEGVFSPTTYHTGLLWALETLVWDIETFARSVLVLARLAEIDPGGRLVNRPINSLKEIFLPWLPNSGATLEQRNAMLTKLAREMPDVSWKMLVDLLPDRTPSSSGTRRPQLREPAGGERDSVTYQEYWDAMHQIIELVIDLAAQEPSRWLEIIRDLTGFPEDERKRALAALKSCLELTSEVERQPIWEALRDRINDHKRFPDAQWSLAPHELGPFEELVNEFESRNPVSSKKWVFDSWDLPTEGNQSVEDLRASTIMELFEKFGSEAVVELGNDVKQPYIVVEALEKASLGISQLSNIFRRSLEEPNGLEFSVGISGLFRSAAGEEQAEKLLKEAITSQGLSEITTAKLLISWPMTSDTWFVVKRLGPKVFENYWSFCNGYRLKGSERSLLRGLLYFLRFGRASAFLEATGRRLKDIPSRLILRALDVLNTELGSERNHSNTMTSYYLEKVFGELDGRSDVDVSEILKHEFAFLPLLDESKRGLKLHEQMAVDPALFHQAICLVFKSSNDTDQSSMSADEKARWRLAYSVLSKFKQLPGSTGTEIDAKILKAWTDNVRALGVSTGHSEITDIYVGHLFAHAPIDKDDGWPHHVVRDEIERIGSEVLERGIRTERYNMRGVTMRGIYDGGEQERELAARYREWQSIAGLWPRTSAVLGAIAENWEKEAKSHDIDAAQRKLRS